MWPRPQPRPHCVRWRPSSPISANVRCGQTAGWIKMPLGMDVGLGPDDFVLGGPSSPPKAARPQFSAYVYCCQTVAHLSCWALVGTLYTLLNFTMPVTMVFHRFWSNPKSVIGLTWFWEHILSPACRWIILHATPNRLEMLAVGYCPPCVFPIYTPTPSVWTLPSSSTQQRRCPRTLRILTFFLCASVITARAREKHDLTSGIRPITRCDHFSRI